MAVKLTAHPEPSPWPAPRGHGSAVQGWSGSQQQQLPYQGPTSPSQVVVLQHMVPQRQVYGNYKARKATALGWILIICGILSIIFNIVGMIYKHYVFYFSSGIFCGIIVSLAMGSLLLILGVVAFVTAVWTSALACGVVCCGATINSATPITLQYVTSPQQPQVVVLDGVPGQPQVIQGLQTGTALQA